MREVCRFALVLGAMVFASGCGDSDHAPVVDGEEQAPSRPVRPRTEVALDSGLDASTATTSTADASSAPDAGGDAATGLPGPGEPNEPGAPSVQVLSPTDEDYPDDVHDSSLHASCAIARAEGTDTKPVDPSTVFVELLDANGAQLARAPGARADEPGVFEASFPTTNLASGPVVVRCTAEDTSASPKLGLAEATTFIDHGPEIAAITPDEGSAESALGAVVFEYRVVADELVVEDELAAVQSVSISLRGKTFELVETAADPEVYRTTVDFADPTVFSELPSGSIQIAVSASNERGITRTLRYEFLLDSRGPTVSIKSPAAAAIVGGTVNLELTLSDDLSGIDWDTLRVTLNDVSHPYDVNGPWRINGNSATFTFESAEVTGSVVQMNVNVAVRDRAGNASQGAAALYYRDEKPPVISLDPPNFREFDANRNTCSLPFDPLGESPPNGARVQDFAQYRALVWDETNQASGQNVFHLSGTNRTSVTLFARRPGAPLVVDTTGNDVCDDIATDGTRFQELTALSPTGNPTYSEDNLPDLVPNVSEASGFPCPGENRTAPKNLCTAEASDLTVVAGHQGARGEPIVYAVSPDRDLECTGRRWELRSAGLENYQGWVCLAVRALDNVGNRGVSKPIAVCLDNDQVTGQPSCWANETEPAPDCSDGCIPLELSPGGIIFQR